MDQFSPSTSDQTFTIPIIRMRGKNATQNLLVNPGGPGASGLGFIYGYGHELNAVVGERFHLLGFDPRGTGASRPLALCYPDEESRRSLSMEGYPDVATDGPETYARSQNMARACVDITGEHGKYINTPQTAADMNSIIDALGQDNMAYWGFSYGSVLGQTYAGLFPNRSRRVIIDGVADQFMWYEKQLRDESMTDTERVFDGFFDECVKAGKACALTAISNSKTELKERVLGVIEQLQKQPLAVYINSTTYGTLDHKKLLYDALFPGFYKPQLWTQLAKNLAKLLQGNATDAYLAYGNVPPLLNVRDANRFIVFNDGLSGPTYWPHNRESVDAQLLSFFNQSRFGPRYTTEYYIKQQWLVPRTHNYSPKLNVETVHPLLILSTTYDPACPLVSARSANEVFKGSRIVEVKGYGHCSLSLPSRCLVNHVRAFLENGTLPEVNALCEAEPGAYFQPLDQELMTMELGEMLSEDERLGAAQLKLATGDWLSP
jgi:pimeloyl-ACP methyl ester carboxylesterase